jgi:hypothetical protein
MKCRYALLMATLAAAILLLGPARSVLAQSAAEPDTSDSVDRRLRFAETFWGIDASAVPAGRFGDAQSLPGRVFPRMSIGGLHFWGHADFAVVFPLTQGTRDSEFGRSSLSTGVETRGRWYLRPARTDGLSPFIGGGLSALDLRIGDGPREYRMQPTAQAGLVYRHRRTMFELGWSARPVPDIIYPTSRTEAVAVRPSAHSVWLGAHRLFETTAGIAPVIRSGEWAEREQSLRVAGRLSGPTVAIGLSSPILTGSGARNRESRLWLAERARARPMLDVGVGWYLDGPDLQLNVAWRRARFDNAAFNFGQRMQRQSVALEGFTFLGDYHGFVPFIGPVFSLDRLALREHDAGSTVTDVSRDLLAAGVVFGWDIRPTRAGDWLLRTNLRWFPRLRLDVNSSTQAFDQLEFNFIQLVWFPRR